MEKSEREKSKPRELAVKIGERIRTIRMARNLSQSELAKMLNISQSVFSKWEAGKVLVTTEHLLRFSESVGIELSDFLKNLGSGK